MSKQRTTMIQSSFTALLMGLFMTMSVSTQASQADQKQTAEFKDGKYHNAQTSPHTTGHWAKLSSILFMKSRYSEPKGEIPIKPLTLDAFYQADNRDLLQFAKLGHSTILLQIDGKLILIDPVFSERASPVQWIGPKRFHPVPMDPETLDNIDAVVISHSHYDHLDKATIKALKDKAGLFAVPKGVGDIIREWGVSDDKVAELEWWESVKLDTLELVATPSQHFSGRGLFDRDETLWASWVIKSPTRRVYFSGDSGYFPGFKTIGEAYGPFDIAFIEAGAYNPVWRDVHMMPEDSIQAFEDINATLLVPVHNGTFDLSIHAWTDPMDRISELAQAKQLNYLIPQMGEIVNPQHPQTTLAWWRQVDCAEETGALFACKDLNN